MNANLENITKRFILYGLHCLNDYLHYFIIIYVAIKITYNNKKNINLEFY